MKKLIGEATHWGIRTKFYYNGAGEQVTMENPKIGSKTIAARPIDFQDATTGIKCFWQEDDLVLA